MYRLWIETTFVCVFVIWFLFCAINGMFRSVIFSWSQEHQEGYNTLRQSLILQDVLSVVSITSYFLFLVTSIGTYLAFYLLCQNRSQSVYWDMNGPLPKSSITERETYCFLQRRTLHRQCGTVSTARDWVHLTAMVVPSGASMSIVSLNGKSLYRYYRVFEKKFYILVYRKTNKPPHFIPISPKQ